LASKRPYYNRILVTSLLILIIPTLILGTLFYREFLVKFRHRLTDSYVNQIEQFNSDNANDFMVLNHLIVRISNKSELTRFQLSLGGVHNKAGVEVINDYKLSNPFVDEIFLYYLGSDDVYNSKGMFMLNNVPSIYKGIDDLFSKYERAIHENPERSIFGPVSIESTLLDADRFIALVYSIPPESNMSMGIVLFLISEQKFWKPLENLHNADITLKTLDGSLISSFSGTNTQLAANHRTLGFAMTGRQNLFRYHISIDLSELFQIVSPRRMVFFLIMAATVVLGIAITIVFSLFNYRPVDNLVQRNERLQENLVAILAENKIHSRHKLLIDLISNKGKTINKVELDTAGLRLDYPFFFVAVVHADQMDKILLHSFLEFELRESIGYGVELEGENLIALLICSTCANLDIQAELRRQVHDTPNSSSSKSRRNKIACGSFVPDLVDISSSFYEAAFKLEREELESDRVDIHNRDITKHPFPAEEMNLLTLAVKCGDTRRAGEVIETITERLNKFLFSIFRMKMICLEIGYHLLMVLEEMGLDKDHFQENIFYFAGVEQWRQNMEEILTQTDMAMKMIKRKETEKKQNEMIIYINSNFHKYNFSLESLADSFNCSSPYASKHIKKILGQSFSEYLFALRSNKVKRDLAASEDTIQEIVHNAGYSDASNFIRKFRIKEGITPGQYRQMLLNVNRETNA
jgi:two-component system, response regulator YesN